MPLPNEKFQNQESIQSKLSRLNDQVRAETRKKEGLSTSFKTEAATEGAALKLCEEAMVSLADNMMPALESFQISQDARQSLEALEIAERSWQASHLVIREFDESKEESAFLDKVRDQMYTVCQKRLRAEAETCHRQANPARRALCLGIIGVMDTILAEHGLPPHSPQRRQLQHVSTQLL